MTFILNKYVHCYMIIRILDRTPQMSWGGPSIRCYFRPSFPLCRRWLGNWDRGECWTSRVCLYPTTTTSIIILHRNLRLVTTSELLDCVCVCVWELRIKLGHVEIIPQCHRYLPIAIYYHWDRMDLLQRVLSLFVLARHIFWSHYSIFNS